jgi:hypothetical protein
MWGCSPIWINIGAWCPPVIHSNCIHRTNLNSHQNTSWVWPSGCSQLVTYITNVNKLMKLYYKHIPRFSCSSDMIHDVIVIQKIILVCSFPLDVVIGSGPSRAWSDSKHAKHVTLWVCWLMLYMYLHVIVSNTANVSSISVVTGLSERLHAGGGGQGWCQAESWINLVHSYNMFIILNGCGSCILNFIFPLKFVCVLVSAKARGPCPPLPIPMPMSKLWLLTLTCIYSVTCLSLL